MTDPIEQELTLSQRAYLRAIARRRTAVVNARQERPPTRVDDGKPKSIYRISRLLGVEESAVRSILKTAEKEGKT